MYIFSKNITISRLKSSNKDGHCSDHKNKTIHGKLLTLYMKQVCGMMY